MQRREFFKLGAAVGLAELLGPRLFAEIVESTRDASEPVPRRKMGRFDVELSVVGLGGFAVVGATQEATNNLVAEAVDRGVNYFDVAPSYGRDREAEKKLGIAMKPYRDRIFLACKTQARDRSGAMADLEESLKTLQTDHFELYQMHAIQNVERDVTAGLAEGGAMEAFDAARTEGKIRYVGFSSHSVEAAVQAIESDRFDTILHPTNFVCHMKGRFDQAPMQAAAERGMGRLALKPMARTQWPSGMARGERKYPNCWYEPIADAVLAALAFRWTLGQGMTAAIPPADVDLTRIALNVASKDKPLEEQELVVLTELAETLNPLFRGPDAV